MNPWGPSILIKLVGLKVWLFYHFLLIPVGMSLISEKNDLKNFCNVFAISLNNSLYYRNFTIFTLPSLWFIGSYDFILW